MRLDLLNGAQVESIVQHELLVQCMEQTPLEMTQNGEVVYTIKMYNLVNRVKMLKQNMRALPRDSREYVVAAAKFAELNGYVKLVREKTINNEEWRETTLETLGNVQETVQLVVDYDVEAEHSALHD